MKKIRIGTAVKVVTFIFMSVSIIYMAVGTAATARMYEKGFYRESSGLVLLESMEDLMYIKAGDAVYEYYDAVRSFGEDADNITIEKYSNIFSEENSNFYFVLKDEEGNEILRNYYDDDYRFKISSEYEYYGESVPVIRYEMFSNYSEMEAFDPYIYYGDEFYIDSCQTYREQGSEEYYCVVKGELYIKEKVVIDAYVKSELTARDEFYWYDYFINLFYSLRYIIPLSTMAAAVLFIMLFAFLMAEAGHRKGKEGIYLSWFDRIPFDLITAAIVIGGVFCASFLIDYTGGYTYDSECMVLVLFYAICIIGYIITFAARIKKGQWWRNTIIYYVINLMSKLAVKVFHGLVYVFRCIPLVWKAGLIYLAVMAVEGIAIALFWDYPGWLVLFWLLEKLLTALVLFFVVLNMRTLQKGGQQLADGNLEHKVDLRHMFRDFKKHGENLNSINVGISNAVAEKMKSERFRTELITNVSHDIKTPLTSIVNYVDLLKKEDIQSENAVKYIEVLDRQSARLKKLIEDLVEASKASTGNIAVNFMTLDVNVLLSQTVGEYVDKLAERNIRIVADYGSRPVYISADGRLMWRVLDNLMNNINKYTQDGTRVYINIKSVEDEVTVTFRNVSKYELNVSANELMERFVRGDSSRNTEGSGLGLSIAASLTELQNGKMDLFIDGDLFKVVLTFKICRQIEPV